MSDQQEVGIKSSTLVVIESMLLRVLVSLSRYIDINVF